MNRHAQKSHRFTLAYCDQHVHLTAWAGTRHTVGKPKKVIGLFAHSRDHHHNFITRSHGPGNMFGDSPNPVGVTDGSATKLLNK